ncbi:hypothetical protein DL96DRAFT_1229547 [Flagelloscypha sp. PMI_526]|nr:hypothetical protein DL96DRAFT_1229547 [Flagelloscypha sp. PMI_526]
MYISFVSDEILALDASGRVGLPICATGGDELGAHRLHHAYQSSCTHHEAPGSQERLFETRLIGLVALESDLPCGCVINGSRGSDWRKGKEPVSLTLSWLVLHLLFHDLHHKQGQCKGIEVGPPFPAGSSWIFAFLFCQKIHPFPEISLLWLRLSACAAVNPDMQGPQRRHKNLRSQSKRPVFQVGHTLPHPLAAFLFVLVLSSAGLLLRVDRLLPHSWSFIVGLVRRYHDLDSRGQSMVRTMSTKQNSYKNEWTSVWLNHYSEPGMSTAATRSEDGSPSSFLSSNEYLFSPPTPNPPRSPSPRPAPYPRSKPTTNLDRASEPADKSSGRPLPASPQVKPLTIKKRTHCPCTFEAQTLCPCH